MGFLRRRDPIRPEFITPPQDLAAIRDVEGVDQRLELIAVMNPAERTTYTWAYVDRLLDQRNAIRPGRPAEVPVVPGRVESIIANRLENP
jgi:hypothetical protein